MVGWNANGAGHGFTLVNERDWQGAVGSAILSHLGFHAPLLLVNDPDRLPAPVSDYLAVVRPTFLVSPGDGPYNMVYVVGNYARISWPVQVAMNASQEMANRHTTHLMAASMSRRAETWRGMSASHVEDLIG